MVHRASAMRQGAAIQAARASVCGSSAWISLATIALLMLIAGVPSSRAEAQVPVVHQIVFRGLAAGDSTYYLDEVVRVRVRFSRHVDVDVSGGAPYVDLTVGAATRRAEYRSSRQNYTWSRRSAPPQSSRKDGSGVARSIRCSCP